MGGRVGTTVFCPECKAFQTSRTLPLDSRGYSRARRWYRQDHRDIAWFRRLRRCNACGNDFLTAEVEEQLLEELAALRGTVARAQSKLVRQIRRSAPWLSPSAEIPRDLAYRLVSRSAVWLTHSSGHEVRAPGHADRLQRTDLHGWEVEFGGNSFLVGKAIERSSNVLNRFMDDAATGRLIEASRVKQAIAQEIAGAVANSRGAEYSDYPVVENRIVFGAQAIDLNDATSVFWQATKADCLFRRR